MLFVYAMALCLPCYHRTVCVAKILPHALSCPFPITRHNKVQDLTASLLTEVCHDVQVEPHFHALSGEVMHHRLAVLNDNARVDIQASGFWRCLHHCTFFDVRVFNSFRSTTLAATFCMHEAEKRRAYEERIHEVEHGSFTHWFFFLWWNGESSLYYF